MAAAKINVLERFKDVIASIKNGYTKPDEPHVMRTLEMAQRHIDNLEKNQGFGAQKRADIAAQLMASGFTGVDMRHAAKYAVQGADALLYELVVISTSSSGPIVRKVGFTKSWVSRSVLVPVVKNRRSSTVASRQVRCTIARLLTSTHRWSRLRAEPCRCLMML